MKKQKEYIIDKKEASKVEDVLVKYYIKFVKSQKEIVV